MNKGARMVADAILMRDFVTVVVAGKAYTVTPPTIRRIAGAARHLSVLGGEETIADVIRSLASVTEAASALSWLIGGDENLSDELAEGTMDEVADALETALSLISVKGFRKLSGSARNVTDLTARPR